MTPCTGLRPNGRELIPQKFTAATELLEAAERQLAQGSAGGDAPDSRRRLRRETIQSLSVGKSTGAVPEQVGMCMQDGESLVAEKFRFLGVRLRHLQQKRPFKRLLITSSMPEEGKSTVAANLACTLARRQQQKILLLDGDLRRPTLARQFGLGKLPGLSEWLEGDDCSGHEYLQTGELGLLDFAGRQASQRSFGTVAVRKLPS